MKVLFATTLLGLFATGVKAACGEKHLGDPGAEFYLDCRHHACNVLELDAQDNIRNQYGVKPVGDGSCKIKIRVYGDGGLRDIANHENTATIIPTGDVMCDTFDVKEDPYEDNPICWGSGLE
eukprot:g15966.t1